eukprot:TRINITY_DN3397_c0_g1_i3.p1 TRINITY_DN3397_c0_g1~~TRINITY_DN3397_c0_g1_i3.p1  ORF type:complete len:174 (+),score=22.75 TRINITY_DN3397_c0_g1_i3:418-939(+)
MYFSLILVGIGSAYYHWDPTTQTLFWDRLPMSFAFMSLFSSLLSDWIDPKFGNRLLWPLILFGSSSVVQWIYSENIGSGDLRFYLFMQVFPVLSIVPLIALFPPRYSHSYQFIASLVVYGLSRLSEVKDRDIYELTDHVISGHSIKHLLIAAAVHVITLMLKQRTPVIKSKQQ